MNQAKIWDYYQSEGVDNFNDAIPRLKYLFYRANKIAGNNIPTILNVGYGNGWIEKECVKHNWNVFSLDPSHKPDIKNNTINFVSGTLENSPFFDEQFDIVFCSEVLEHLDNDQLVDGVAEIKRILKKGGVLIGTVPFKENLTDNMVVCPGCAVKFHRWGHHQEFDKRKLGERFEINELTIIDLKSKVFRDYTKNTPSNIIKYIIRLALNFFGSTSIYSNLFFMVTKK